jgi:hypothetical protein
MRAVLALDDALHGERRDRSIPFWKSLPVSDFTTVLSKASIPLRISPRCWDIAWSGGSPGLLSFRRRVSSRSIQ